MNKPPAERSRRILVIDDNRAIHDDFRKILSRAATPALATTEALLFGIPPNPVQQIRYEIDSAYQGQDGATMVKQALADGRPYAMAFVDIRMPPGWDGVETTREIWALDPDVQIVLCTAYTDYSWDEIFEKVGNTDGLVILKKPFDAVEALQLAHALTDKWWLHQLSRQKMKELGRMVYERTAELLRTNEALQLQQTELRVLFDLMPAMIWFKDTNNGILRINQRAAEAAGRPVEEIEGKQSVEIYPQDSARFYADDLEVMRSGLPKLGFVEMLRGPENKEIWVQTDKVPYCDKDGKVIGLVVMARDITEARRAEEALRESEERFKFVARAMSDVVWDRNLSAGTLWWNDGFLTTFGYVASDLEPIEAWSGRIHPDERRRVVDSIQQAIDSGAAGWNADYRFQRKSGSYAHVHDRGYILRDASGLAVRMVGGMRDLTEQKAAEAQYLRAQRMESIGTLAGGIAHDLNNVLSPIMMSIELLKSDSGNDPRAVRILDTVQASCRRGADLVRQVLTFARGVDGERIPIRLRHLINDLDGIVSETFPRNIQIVTDVPDDLWPITGDATQIHQVLLNLAVNARDAMPRGGTLTVTASNITLDDQYAGTSQDARAGTYVMLQVVDTGEGMPPAVRARIFEPFFTTKEVGKGTGIGLATVDTIVKNHDGFMNVESEVGVGTTFKIYLPADPAHRLAATAHPFKVAVPRGRDELVLVVDDESSIREITQRTLEAFGYRVIIASDGAEAIALYAKQTEQIAVVLTDLMMPIMDGRATIEVLMRINPSVKIIAASGVESGASLTKAPNSGVSAFLQKPYTAETLLRLIREIIDRPPFPSLDETSVTP